MYKSKFFKKYIGFNHDWLVLATIVFTGIAFPYIFLAQSLASLIHNITFAIPIGLFYSTVLIIGNLHIFYKTKRSYQPFNQSGQFIWPIRQYVQQIVFTILASIVLSVVPEWAFRHFPSARYIIQNVIGSLLFAALYISIYEVFYFMTAFKKSLRIQEKLKRDNLSSQLEILKNQIQPHFLFNSLNTLTGLIPDEPSVAIEYVQNLSKVYRYVLEIKNKKLIPVQDELRCIKAYLFLLKIRFGENLRTDIQLLDATEEQLVVPLSLQMLIENAVKHNIISQKKPLTINIRQKEKNTLEVCNNFQPKIDVDESTGIGLENISNRYKITVDKDIEIHQTKESFCVTIPLISISK